MIRQDAQRTLLYDLDSAIQRLAGSASAKEETVKACSVQFTGVYHNLLRQWAEM
jgi:PKHD-type hydroxylase